MPGTFPWIFTWLVFVSLPGSDALKPEYGVTDDRAAPPPLRPTTPEPEAARVKPEVPAVARIRDTREVASTPDFFTEEAELDLLGNPVNEAKPHAVSLPPQYRPSNSLWKKQHSMADGKVKSCHEVAYLIPKDKFMCVEGKELYLKEVLAKMRSSNMQYAWNQSVVTRGTCANQGFSAGPSPTMLARVDRSETRGRALSANAKPPKRDAVDRQHKAEQALYEEHRVFWTSAPTYGESCFPSAAMWLPSDVYEAGTTAMRAFMFIKEYKENVPSCTCRGWEVECMPKVDRICHDGPFDGASGASPSLLLMPLVLLALLTGS